PPLKGATTVIKPGDQVRLGSAFGPELKLSSVHGQTFQDGSVAFQRAGEDVWHRTDGNVQVSDRAGITRVEDQTGKVILARTATGSDQAYSYGPDGQLTRIEYQNGRLLERKQGDGWTVSRPGKKTSTWSGDIDVNPDGSLTYADGVNPPWRERLDGTSEILHPDGRVEYRGAKVDLERTRLDALADYNFSNPQQRERFRTLAGSFEERAQKSGLSDEEVALTY